MNQSLDQSPQSRSSEQELGLNTGVDNEIGTDVESTQNTITNESSTSHFPFIGHTEQPVQTHPLPSHQMTT